MMAEDTKKKKKDTKKDLSKKTHYTYNEALQESTKYFQGDELAASTWLNKYAKQNKQGDFLECTPDDMHRRMAREFARIEKQYPGLQDLNGDQDTLSPLGKKAGRLSEERIYELFRDFRYVIPQGSVMATLGNEFLLSSLSNCVVLPEIHDSYGGIFYTDQQLAQLFKRRCGVGIDISGLRPGGSHVDNAAGSTTGAASFMERFSNTTREVAQNGRRGALMITMDVAHPDIEEFVTKKQDLKSVTGANVSVRLTDEFMEAVRQDGYFTLRYPIDSENPSYTRNVKARELWQTIIKCAHNTAEPGLIFWDRQRDYSTSAVYPGFENVSTNPCSEIAMQGGDSCRLIALNLYNFVKDPFTPNATFDHEKFQEVTYDAQRLMDDLVDLELESIDQILKKVDQDDEPEHVKRVEKETWQLLYNAGKKGRRTGLGFTGLGDTMAAMGYAFHSNEAMNKTEEIMKAKCEAEFQSSIDMAIERGSFEDFDPEYEKRSRFNETLQQELPDVYDRMLDHGRRNISISTVAPTGTLSLLAQVSSGIEPVFMSHYTRRRKINPNDENARVDFVDDVGDSWQEFEVYHPKLKTWMEATGETDPENSPYEGSTAPEIDWIKRVEMQGIVQKYVTHSISSTINLPSDVTEEKVGEIYLEAWKRKLKGITVYRDGSRSGVLVSDDQQKEKENEFKETHAPHRPKVLEADVVRFQNDNEQWIAVVGILNGRPYEIFTGQADSFILPKWVKSGNVIKNKMEDGSKRYDFQFTDKEGYRVTIEGLSRSFEKEYWNYAKLISGILRHGMPLPYAVDLISNLNLYSDSINTWKNGVTRALKQYIPDGTEADHKCPKCEDPNGLIYEEGCLTCKSCGYSQCG